MSHRNRKLQKINGGFGYVQLQKFEFKPVNATEARSNNITHCFVIIEAIKETIKLLAVSAFLSD